MEYKLPAEKMKLEQHCFINSVGVKMLLLYYARKQGINLEYPKIKSLNSWFYRKLLMTEDDSWIYLGYNDISTDNIYQDNVFPKYIADVFDEYFDNENFPEEFELHCNLDCILSSIYVAGSITDSVYTPAEDLDILNLGKIYHNYFVHSIPYPDTDIGRVAEMSMDAMECFIFQDLEFKDVSGYFLSHALFHFCQTMYYYRADESAFFNCYGFIHPYGQAVLDFLNAEMYTGCKNPAFYRKARKIASACLEQLQLPACLENDNPELHVADLYTDGISLLISILYYVDGDIPEIVLSIYVLKDIIDRVFRLEEPVIRNIAESKNIIRR